MNRTIISIEVQDHGGKEANIIVRGERNNQIFFEEQFDYKYEDKHSLRLHLLKGRFMEKFPKLGESLGILCIRKLFNDITIRSKFVGVPDYRVIDKQKLTLEVVENRLKDIAQKHNIDLMNESVLYLYSEEYGSLTNEIADILYPRYGFKGIYPTPKLRTE